MIAIMSQNLTEIFRTCGGRLRRIASGAYLFHLGEPVTSLFLVLEGEVRLVRHHGDGGMIVLQRARTGDVLAEASLFAGHYHCDAIAGTDSTVIALPKRQLLDRFRNDPDFAEGWAAHLAREIQLTRFRSEVLSLRTVADRLDAWLAWHGPLPPKGEWKELAYEIGVSPEALYREIARRRA
jgi:CRP-like cAMP-binding protein